MKNRLFAGAIAFCDGLTLFPPAAFVANGKEQSATAQYFSDITDIIEPITPPDTGTDGNDSAEGEEILLQMSMNFSQMRILSRMTLHIPRRTSMLVISFGFQI